MKEPFLCRRKKPSAAAAAAVNGQSRKLKLVCSFNGAFQRRPPSGKLRYIGGETRIISVDRAIGFAKLRSKISDLCPRARSFSVKYHLPEARNGRDGGRDAPLVPVASDEDVRCMIEEHEKVEMYGKHSRFWLYVCSEDCVSVEGDRDLYVNCVGVHRIEGEIGRNSGNRVMCGDDSLRKVVLKQQISVKQSSQNVNCFSCCKGNETEMEAPCYGENLKYDHPLIDLAREPHVPISFPNLENLSGLNISDCKLTSTLLPRSDPFGNVIHYAVTHSHPLNPRDGNLIVEANKSGQVLCNGDDSGQSVRIVQQSYNASMNSGYPGSFAFEEGTMSIMNRENVPWTANSASVKTNQVPLSCNGQLVGIAYPFDSGNGHKLRGSLLNHQLGVNDTRNQPIHSSHFRSHWINMPEISNYQAVGLDRRPLVGKCYPVLKPNSNISKAGQSGRSYHHPLKIYTGFHTPKFDGRTTVVKPSNEDVREVGVLAVPLDGNPNPEGCHLAYGTCGGGVPEKPLLSHDAVVEAPSCLGTMDAQVDLLMGFSSEVPCKTIHENFRAMPICCEVIDGDLEKECLLINPQKVTNNSVVTNNPVYDSATKLGYSTDVLDAETSNISVSTYKNATRTLNGKLESTVDLSLCNLSLSSPKKVEPATPYLADCDVSEAFLNLQSKSFDLIDEGQLGSGPVVDKSNGHASNISSHIADKLENNHLCDKEIQEDPLLGLSHDGKADIKEGQNCLKVTNETGTFVDQSTFYTRLVTRELQIIKNSDLEHVKELGSGSYGTVFHGKWKGSDVAIKRIKPSCLTEGGMEENRLIADFWREAHILGQLQHPNIVALYGVVTEGPVVNLATVTEYMVNGSLKQVLRRKDRTIDRRKRLIIAKDAAFGMEYLHEKNIVHFDLKSHNFLVNIRDPQRPVCKIGDLGLSKIKQKTLISGGVRGTIPWMAPELLNSENNLVTEKVDVYSFGIVMWELLTGEEPYGSMRSEEIIAGIIKGNLRPEIPNWCEPAWRSLMKRCWSSDPNSRPSFSEIAKELRAMSASMNIN